MSKNNIVVALPLILFIVCCMCNKIFCCWYNNLESYCWHHWLEVNRLMITFHISFIECNDMIMWYMQLNETNSFPIKSMSNICNCLLQLIRYKLPIQCHMIASCTSLFVIIMYNLYTCMCWPLRNILRWMIHWKQGYISNISTWNRIHKIGKFIPFQYAYVIRFVRFLMQRKTSS